MSELARTHRACGRAMTSSIFGDQDPTPEFRSQPILLCVACGAWEPDAGWHGALPARWDGKGWMCGHDQVVFWSGASWVHPMDMGPCDRPPAVGGA